MAKKKRARQQATERPKSQAPATAKPSAQARATGATRPAWLWWAVGGGLLLVLGLIIAAVMFRSSASIPSPVIAMGQVAGCRAVPRFASAQGFQSVTFNSDDLYVTGLKMVDGSNPQNVYKHPSWASAGFLGPVMADGQGNIYTVPVPRISLIDNPLQQQNRIYRVDTNTAEMKLFVELPAAAPPGPQNAYGALGLGLDCETNSLYVSSVAGSTADKELGRIFRIDLSSGKIVAQLDGIDAMGLGVFKTGREKRLYFGSTRVSEIRSIGLDTQGNFVGSQRVEFPISAPGASGSDKARRITFTDAGEMQIAGRQFDYNLVANTRQPRLQYVFRYQPATQSWSFVSYTPR